jgi:glycosyltransferase involved in cell wall biosynthesis
MRILHIHTSLSGGGIEAMICGLVNQMVVAHDVTLATIFKPKASDIFENKLDKRVQRISLGKEKSGFSVSEIFKIYRLITTGNYDVVHIHGFFYYFALSVLLLHHKVKFFYTIHSDAEMENSAWDKRLLWLKRTCFARKYIQPITISPASKDSFTRFYNVDSILINNGVQKPVVLSETNILSDYKISPLSKVFVHAGRINRAKNQVVLCRAFAKLIDEGYDVVLLIAGGNNDEGIMSELRPFFSQRIVYLGERNDITTLLSYADAMCLPSIWEGMPVVLLEALSVGCIPICSPVGGVVNVVKDGVNGFLSTDSSVDSYYSALRRYLDKSEDELGVIKQNCIDSFDPYDIRQVSEKYLSVYQSI